MTWDENKCGLSSGYFGDVSITLCLDSNKETTLVRGVRSGYNLFMNAIMRTTRNCIIHHLSQDERRYQKQRKIKRTDPTVSFSIVTIDLRAL